MKFFTDCSGRCCVCDSGTSGRLCLAGHGDDYFRLAPKEDIIKNLDNGRYPSYTDYMIETLKDIYGYEYKKARVIDANLG